MAINLLLQQVCNCDCPSKEGLVLNELIADIYSRLQEMYMSSMLVSSTAVLIEVESVLMVACSETVVTSVF